MEQELGVKLFKRGKGSSRIELTESGEAYFEYVSLALNNLDTGLRVAREIQGEANSLVRVGTVYSMQGMTWSQAMQAFLAKNHRRLKSRSSKLIPRNSFRVYEKAN